MLSLLSIILSCTVPLLGHVLLPLLVFSDLLDPVLNNGERLPNLIVLHVLLIIQIVGKLNEVVDFLFFMFLFHFGCHGPRRSRLAFLRLELTAILVTQLRQIVLTQFLLSSINGNLLHFFKRLFLNWLILIHLRLLVVVNTSGLISLLLGNASDFRVFCI